MSKIAIVGGGIIGSSTAYHLALAGYADRTVVIEPDPTYEWAATPRSTGGIRVLFSTPENIRMSLYGHEFYRDFESRMAIDGQPAPIDFRKAGYLFMGQGRAGAAVFEECWRIQIGEGAEVLLLDGAGVKARFPSLETHDVDAATYAPNDGFMDPHAALFGVRRKAVSLGVAYRRDRVVDFERHGARITQVTLESGAKLAVEHVVNAANCWGPELCERLGMKVPVAPMRRMNFWFDCRESLEPLPLVRHAKTPSGFRPEGTGYLTGYTNYDEPRGFNWEVDNRVFDDIVWPMLAERVKPFAAIKLQRAWACHYDQNSLDANHIIGNWPGHLDNFWIALGLSGHGLQHAPAIGRALTELIVDGGFKTLDLARFGYQRVLDGKPLLELGVLA